MTAGVASATRPSVGARLRGLRPGRIAMIAPAIALLVLVFYLPLIRLLTRSVIDEETGSLTLAQFERLIANDNMMLSYFTSVWLAAVTVAVVILLGYPLAYALANLPPRVSAILFIFVMVPFWTSLTVRMFAFWILLGRQGPVNGVLTGTGIIEQPMTLLFTWFSVLVGFSHIALPLMVFPLYATMRGIDKTYVLAAQSMGASPLRAFWSVYLPLSLPGVVAGSMLVFITTVGYFIVPVLLGGKSENMIGQFIMIQVQQRADLPLASAMTALLLVITVVVLLVVSRLARFDRLLARSDEGANW